MAGYNAVQSVESQPTFRRKYRLHHQDRRISRARYQRESRWCRLFFGPEDGGDVPPKRRLSFNGLHGIISPRDSTLHQFGLHVTLANLNAPLAFMLVYGGTPNVAVGWLSLVPERARVEMTAQRSDVLTEVLRSFPLSLKNSRLWPLSSLFSNRII
jgi:hypothetical protein